MASVAKGDGLAKQWLAGAVAGSVEAVVTMPLEVLKTRLQVAGKGRWDVVFNRQASFSSAFAGLSPMLLQTSMKVGIRFAAYEQLRKADFSAAFAGFGAGAFEALVWITPTERLKVILIMNKADPNFGTLRGALRNTLKTQGIVGLWRGGSATVARNGFTNGARFWIVDQVRPWLNQQLPDQKAYHSGIAGSIAGAMTTVVNQPIDVIKTRMNSDSVGTKGAQYSGNIDCARKIWQEGGVKAYTQGLSARIAKISIGQGVIFFVYDFVSRHL
jgi:solute carrier family 25 (mitochondrial citrate transporter), member 1